MEDINEVGGSKVMEQYTSKESGTRFFTSRAKLAFAELRHAFSTALISHYFDSEYQIWTETDILGHVSGEILSQLTLDNWGQ